MNDGTEQRIEPSQEWPKAPMSRRKMLATVAVGTGAAWVAPTVLGILPAASATSAPCTTTKTTDCKLLRTVCTSTPEGSTKPCAISYQWGTNGWEACEPQQSDYTCLGGTSSDYGWWQDCEPLLTCSGDQTSCSVSIDPNVSGGDLHGGFVVFDSYSPTTPIVNPTQPGTLDSGGRSLSFAAAT